MFDTDKTPLDEILTSARICFRQGKIGEAETLCKEAIESDEHCAQAWHLLGLVDFNLKRNDEAVEHLTKSIELQADWAESHGDWGCVFTRLGRDAQAVACFERSVQLDQRYHGGWFNLGILHRRAGRLKDARQAAEKAIELKPDWVQAHYSLGCILGDSELHDQAAECYRRVLNIKPDWTTARYNLGCALMLLDRMGEAIDNFQLVLQQKDDYIKAWVSMGKAMAGAKRTPEAAAAISRAIALDDNYADAHYQFGKLAAACGKLDEAAVSLGRAAEIDAQNPEFQNELGVVLAKLGRSDQAVAAYRRAIELKPNYVSACFSLAEEFKSQNKFDAAIAVYKKMMTPLPKSMDLLHNIGYSLDALGASNDAVEAFDKVLATEPDHAEAHTSRAMIMLKTTGYRQGWDEFEWRLKSRSKMNVPRSFTQPRWDGRQLDGERILLYGEKVFGDTFQFLRYVPLVVARGGKVVLETQDRVSRLLYGFPAAEEVISTGYALPQFDYHCPLVSLPGVFKTTADTVPCDIPYINARQADVQSWADRLGEKKNFRVGIVWAGSPNTPTDATRSAPISCLAPLTTIPGASLYSLQVGGRAGELSQLPAGAINDLSPQLQDFTDAAAAISQMDLVISVDTAAAHLAGAMGKDVWLLLPFVGDWRWLIDRDDSPWYPTMRIFRQQTPGDWDELIQRVGKCMTERIAGK